MVGYLGTVGDDTDLESMLAVMACLDEYIGVSNTNMHLRAAVENQDASWCPIRRITDGWRRGVSMVSDFQVYRQSVDGGWGRRLRRFRRIWSDNG